MATFMQLGVQAAQARNVTEAVGWFQRAHQENPADPVARAWLGQCLCSLGRRLEGVDHLVKAGRLLAQAARVSKDTSKVMEVIGQLQGWGAFAPALELARALVEIDGGNPRAHQLLAVTCGQINLTEEALVAVAEALRLAPGHQMLLVLQASLEADAKQFEAAKARLTEVLAKAPGAREAFRAHKEMARVLDGLGEYDAVFAHLEAAAKLAPTLPEFAQQDARIIPEMIRQNEAGFSAELMGRWAGVAFAETPRAPVFIMGFFRSGTTLTQEVLDVHPDVFVADEAGLLWDMQRELHRMDSAPGTVAEKLARLDEAGIGRLRATYWNLARGRYGDVVDRGLFVDKYTMNTIDVGLISTVFPDAKVVFVLRDPRDVCLSCVMQLMNPTPATRHLLTLEDTAAFYAQVMAWWLSVRERLSVEYLEFRYEDAVESFEPTFQRVFAFLGLSWDPKVVEFHERAVGKFIASPSRNQVAQPLYSSSVARWRRYTAELSSASAPLTMFIDAFHYPK
ncbi:sulfotransferase [Phenylobacterium sp.]|uniref:tetratricopeptide repeat-containing sulfotransferase family protein n=1 Tax=Phenylobacterium sp. TaxID=1871053 RepID=UPI00286C18CB|nr:sulfotransferase [Phenylobacterium sp.]